MSFFRKIAQPVEVAPIVKKEPETQQVPPPPQPEESISALLTDDVPSPMDTSSSGTIINKDAPAQQGKRKREEESTDNEHESKEDFVKEKPKKKKPKTKSKAKSKAKGGKSKAVPMEDNDADDKVDVTDVVDKFSQERQHYNDMVIPALNNFLRVVQKMPTKKSHVKGLGSLVRVDVIIGRVCDTLKSVKEFKMMQEALANDFDELVVKDMQNPLSAEQRSELLSEIGKAFTNLLLIFTCFSNHEAAEIMSSILKEFANKPLSE